MDKANNTLLVVFDDVISAKYKPAKCLSEATMRLSTKEIFEKITEFTGDATICLQDVFELLKSNDFAFDDIGEMNFVWMFRDK